MVTPTNIEIFVENVLSELGINPVLARIGFEFWEFHQGSALVRYFVNNNTYLIATSPLNNLPMGNLDKLYRYLLSNPFSPYQLGIYQNQIYLSYRVHLNDVFSPFSEIIKKNFITIPLKADEIDDFLEKEYGCPKSKTAKAV